MKKVESLKDETLRLAEVLRAKPQAEQKIKYYTGLLITSEKIYEAIQKRIKKGKVNTINWVFGFIPVFSNRILDDMDIAKLEQEMLDIEDTVFNQKNYLEMWKNRKRDIDSDIEDVAIECEANFDKTLEEAQNLSNPRLQDVLSKTDLSAMTSEEKLKLYVYIRQEVNNSKVYAKK